MKPVIVNESCFFPLIISSPEVYRDETYGFIIGKNNRRKIGDERVPVVSLEIAYPLQTAIRRHGESDIGNEKTFERFANSLKALGIDLMSGYGDSDMKLLGGFHSHPNPHGHTRITRGDIKHIAYLLGLVKENGDYRENDCWLELIMHVKDKDYKNPARPNNSKRDYPRKIGNILRFGYDGYEITTAGYWLRVHDLDTDSVRVEEAVLYAHWHLMKK